MTPEELLKLAAEVDSPMTSEERGRRRAHWESLILARGYIALSAQLTALQAEAGDWRRIAAGEMETQAGNCEVELNRLQQQEHAVKMPDASSIPPNEAQHPLSKDWAADDWLWTTQEINPRTFTRVLPSRQGWQQQGLWAERCILPMI